jgi:hypothetical protein
MDIGDMKLQSVSLELRFPESLLLWDNAGKMWSEVKNRWPDIKPVNVTPSNTRFTSGRKFEFNVELSKSHIGMLSPQSTLKDFTENAEHFLVLLQHALMLKNWIELALDLFMKKISLQRKKQQKSF